tara:strand:+ start:918 stop:1364 length:447 start_codon:yes stop_codon:yes gene_type:complete
MASFHFYETTNKNLDEIFEILNEFEKEAPALDYPHINRPKMKQTLMMFLEKGKIILIKDLDKNKIVGITIFLFNEYLWSREQLLSVQVIYILKEYRSFKLFNQTMDIIKNQAKGRHIHLTISTKLMADKLLDRYGFEKLGGLWRYSDV